MSYIYIYIYISMTDEARSTSLCQQTDVGQREIYSSYINGLFPVYVWRAKRQTWESRPSLFGLKANMCLQSQSRLLLMLKCHGTSHTRTELSTNGSSKMVQLSIQQEQPWRSFGKCFQVIYSVAYTFTWPLSVIISFWGTSKRVFTATHHGQSMTSRSQFESKFQRSHGIRLGEQWKLVNEAGQVCTQ
jgi:hypothetical protein